MTPIVVGARVDAITLAYRCNFDPAFVERLLLVAKSAKKHGRAAFRFRTVDGELKYSRADRCWRIRNACCRMCFQLSAPGGVDMPGRKEPGWTVEVVWDAQELAVRSLARVVVDTRRMVQGVADERVIYESRLRRMDLCADVAGCVLSDELIERIVRRPGSKHTRHYGGGGELTGVTICPGAAVLGRIYDKPEELKAKATPEKIAAEHARWTRGGWDGETPVTRVEYQIRGEALRELGIRNPEKPVDPKTGQAFEGLHRVVDRVWQWCLDWMRLAAPGQANVRAKRRALDPVWNLLHAVRFVDGAEEKQGRVRVRGGVTAEQAFGCVLSIVASTGDLPPVDEREPAGLSPERARAVAREEIRAYCDWAGELIAARFDTKWGSIDALEHTRTVVNGTRARFLVPRFLAGPPLAKGGAPALARAVA